MFGNGLNWLRSGFHPAGGAVSFTHASHICSQTYRPYIKLWHQHFNRHPETQTTLPSLLMNHYEHHEPGHQSGWCCHVWKLATELKVTFIIRQTAMRHSIRTAVLSLYFMTLSILRVLFNGSSSEDTEVERATEWIVTVKGQCKIYSCSFWP